MFSTDRKIFKTVGAVRVRMMKYAAAVDGLTIVVLGLDKQEQKEGHLTVFGSSRWRVLFWRPKEKFDLVTSQDPFENGFIAWRLARRLGTKLELQIHTDLGSPYFVRHPMFNRIRILLAKFLLPKADSVRVVSQRIADFLKSAGWRIKALPVVRPIVVDTEKIKNAPIKTDLHKKYPQFDKIILMASRLTREKNIGLAIEAMREMIKQRPKTGLIIVGSGPEAEKLKLKIANCKLENSIILESWTDDLSSYYKTADLFLLTSLYEGYGMTLVEARAAGCPIVSTDVGIAREILPAENIISNNDEKVLARKIILVLAD